MHDGGACMTSMGLRGSSSYPSPSVGWRLWVSCEGGYKLECNGAKIRRPRLRPRTRILKLCWLSTWKSLLSGLVPKHDRT